jgi:NAD(P)-dependent dehydrogenase (short-subunit alcohol dehydrogenase family)
VEGIGFTIAKTLASKGAKVYIGARNQVKARAALDELQRQVNPAQPPAAFVADMSSLEQTRDAALKFLQFENRLDILINNAAV